MYHKIKDPVSKKTHYINSDIGKKILSKYFYFLNQKGGDCDTDPSKLFCTQGPCWDGYIFVGPECNKKGSCIKKDKICKKKRGKGTECKSKIKCSIKKEQGCKNKTEKCIQKYQKCLNVSSKKKMSLCPEGYCTAKNIFDVYPSAYGNGYASQVCKGNKPTYLGEMKKNDNYTERKKLVQQKKVEKEPSLTRWFDEKWVNVCEKDSQSDIGYKVCGSGKGLENQKKYPYCRPYYHLSDSAPVSVEEIKDNYPDKVDEIFDTMCSVKRGKKQGIDGKPTYIRIEEEFPEIVSDILSKRGKNKTEKKELTGLRVSDLKQILSKRGLPVSGNKATLIKRIQDN